MKGLMRTYLRLLSNNPEYAKMWLASVISLTGDWFNTVVLSAMVARYSDGSGIAISIFLMLRVLPPMIVGPLAGVLLDRFNRKHLLVWSNLLRACIVPLYLLAQSPDSLWIIYVVTALQFTLSAIFEPGQSAMIPSLVRPVDIIEGNTLLSVTWSVMLSMGAIIGGLFAFAFGNTAALLADAATFAIAGFLIASVRYTPPQSISSSTAADVPQEDTSLRAGLRYIRQNPGMAAALFIKFGGSLGNIDTLLTIFATQIFVVGAQGELSLGILYSALGLGALMGPLLSNRVNDGSVQKMRRLVLVGFLLLLCSWPILGLAGSLLMVAIAIFTRAMGGSINWTYSNVIIQKTAPDAKLGRMFSIDMVGFQLATVISTLSHGTLIDVLGISQVYWVIWGTMAVGLIPAAIWYWAVIRLEKRESLQPGIAAAGD
jgi:MFS family permease